jgi:hypothetical protein
MARRNLKKFCIGAFIKTWTEIELSAESMEDALAQSRALSVDDFVQYEGEVNEHSLSIVDVRSEIPDVN